MSPVEAGIRAACQAMGASPEAWRQFEQLGLAGLQAFVAALPDDVAELVHPFLTVEPNP